MLQEFLRWKYEGSVFDELEQYVFSQAQVSSKATFSQWDESESIHFCEHVK